MTNNCQHAWWEVTQYFSDVYGRWMTSSKCKECEADLGCKLDPFRKREEGVERIVILSREEAMKL